MCVFIKKLSLAHGNQSKENSFIRVKLHQKTEQQEDEITVSFSCGTNEGNLLFSTNLQTFLTFCFMPLHAKYLSALLPH